MNISSTFNPTGTDVAVPFDLTKFTPRNNRTIQQGDLVAVHWNSHQNTWSIVEMKSQKTIGLVKGYAHELTLTNAVTFKIDKTKQRTVIEHGAKDRHAFVIGYIESFEVDTTMNQELYYNPFKVRSFVDKSQFLTLGEQAPLLTTVNRATFTYKEKPIVYYH